MWNNLKRVFLFDVWIVIVLVLIFSEAILHSLIFFNLIPISHASARVDATSYSWPSFITRDGINYEKLRVTQRVRFTHRPTGKTIYDVNYVFDSNGFRVSESGPKSGPKDLLLLGDSFAFGWGLNYSDTLDSHFSRFGFETVNRALPGISLNDIESLNPKRISISPGLDNSIKHVVYIFNEVQFERVLMTYVSFLYNRSFVENKAFYELSDGKLHYKGTFKEERLIKNFLLGLASNFTFLYFLDPTLVGLYNKSDAELFLRLLESVKSELNEYIEGADYYFVIYPKTNRNIVEMLASSRLLESWKIIDLSFMRTDSKTDYIEFDGHPTGELNLRLAQKYLRKYFIVRRISLVLLSFLSLCEANAFLGAFLTSQSPFYKGVDFYKNGFDIRDCRRIFSIKRVLCFEGYTYSMIINEKPLFNDLTDFGFDELRGIYTGFGLAASRKIDIRTLLKNYSNSVYIYQIIDGWGFGQSSNLLRLPEMACEKLPQNDLRRVCLFGLGRASHIFKFEKTFDDDIATGNTFASNVLATEPASYLYRNDSYFEMLYHVYMSNSEEERSKNSLYSCLKRKRHILFCN